ncbi:hypothetical protein HispidOSU_020023, partial [Sigmodon hispidus]
MEARRPGRSLSPCAHEWKNPSKQQNQLPRPKEEKGYNLNPTGSLFQPALSPGLDSQCASVLLTDPSSESQNVKATTISKSA